MPCSLGVIFKDRLQYITSMNGSLNSTDRDGPGWQCFHAPESSYPKTLLKITLKICKLP